MKFLPTEDITYKSKLREEEIVRRLGEIMEPKKAIRLGLFGSGSTRQYEGQISGHSFTMQRIITYRNSFLPRISGTTEKDYSGTVIAIKMRLNIFVMVFISVAFAVVGIACIAFLVNASHNPEFDTRNLFPVGVLLFLYGITMGGFKFESIKSKKYLQELFEAEIEE